MDANRGIMGIMGEVCLSFVFFFWPLTTKIVFVNSLSV